jgi:CubicO group peptidase (beta-lactamase class C family)
MASLRSAAVLICLSVGACAPHPPPRASAAPASPPSAAAERGTDLGGVLDAHLRAKVERGFSGVVLVAIDDSVILHEAYSADPTVTRESAFWIGSLSKPFAAAAILQLREQGRISLEKPVSEYLPDVPADKRGMTIHQLLTHSSGLGHRYASDGIADRAEAVRTILALPLEHTPGEFGYSNDGYSLLAAIVSSVSGLSYEEYLRRHVLEPAGMRQSGFWGEPVTGVEAALAPVRKSPGRRVAHANWGYRGATGLRSTAADLLRWDRALRGDAVLGATAREAAFSAQLVLEENVASGYGWQVMRTVRGTRLVTHSGAESGLEHYASLRRYVDEGITVVLLSNARESLTWDVQRSLISTLFAALQPPAS